MRGTYRFYQQGKLIGKSENLITSAGRRHILRYLAGQEPRIAGSISVGVGQSEPLGSDTHLTYEFDRATIYLVSPDYNKKTLVFKGTLAREVVGVIYEVGLYSTPYGSFSTGNPSRSLVSFESGVESWSSGSFVSGNQRLGSNALRLEPAASGTVSSVLPSVMMDLSGYANTDEITVAFYCLNTNTSSVKVRLRGSDPANYYEFNVTDPMQGYNVRSVPKSSLARVGIPDFALIDSIEVSTSASAAGAAGIDFDGLRIEAFNPDLENILVSRSILSQPIVKSDIQEMDIEYMLEVSI